MGWGKCAVYFGCYSSWKLKHGDLRVKAQDSCQLTFGTTYSQRYSICARDPAEKTADCNGDSGGPVVKKGATAREDVLVGIVSYGPHNCLSGPSAYAKVSGFHNWVKNVMKNRWGLTLGNNDVPFAAPTSPPVAAPISQPTSAVVCKDKNINACKNLRRLTLKRKNELCENRLNLRNSCPRSCFQCNHGKPQSDCCEATFKGGCTDNIACYNDLKNYKSCGRSWDLFCAIRARKKVCTDHCAGLGPALKTPPIPQVIPASAVVCRDKNINVRAETYRFHFPRQIFARFHRTRP
uniref:Peptidase S1 domain-containing protein n=1 Tax=Corethron hystrix TaxID=216773 RepID=A0A7S1FMQ5_9STRA|mmetsp:Transcript_14457/g.31776  ORF Transcript_14457/g.31776 Transcript_14457/m.31776 type:complete len:293 (+) Transcript_14457:307-1185(+)